MPLPVSERSSDASVGRRSSRPSSGEPLRPPPPPSRDAAHEAAPSWRRRPTAASDDRRRFARQADRPRSGVAPGSRRASVSTIAGQARLRARQAGRSRQRFIGVGIDPPRAVPDLYAVTETVGGADLAAPQLGIVIVGAFDDLDCHDSKFRIEKIATIRVHKTPLTDVAAPDDQPVRSSSAPLRCLYDSGPPLAVRARFTGLLQRRVATPKTAWRAPLCVCGGGGWGGIRTHGELAPSPVFKTGALNRSATHPRSRAGHPDQARGAAYSRVQGIVEACTEKALRECELKIANIDLKTKRFR
jgi:hypothetical protein